MNAGIEKRISDLKDRFTHLSESECRFIVYRFDPEYEPVAKESTADKKNEVAQKESEVEFNFVNRMIDGDDTIEDAISYFLDRIIGDVEWAIISSTQIHIEELLSAIRQPMKSMADPDKELKAREVKLKCNTNVFELNKKLNELIHNMSIDSFGAKISLKKKKKAMRFDQFKENGIHTEV